ncbi:outer membrane beta-barrel protein [candidate division WOR-3 bacterium]|nr:outer membrane beta-barrel protein [candidate division WOR-3 bacterium]
MKICKYFIILFALEFASQSLAGKLTIGVKASIYDPPGAPGPTPMVGGYVSYSIGKYLNIEGAVEWSNYDNTTFMPITVNTVYHPLGRKVFNPYIGGGIGYYYKKVNDAPESTIGCQLLLGLNWNPPQAFGLSLEIKYIIPDIKNTSESGFSYGGAITGTMIMEL